MPGVVFMFGTDGTFSIYDKERGMTPPIYIFDLDGTLALNEHRRHFVENVQRSPDFKADWEAFFAACVDDEPNWPVIHLMRNLIELEYDVRIWSGRSDEVRFETENWLTEFCGVSETRAKSMLKMRPRGDYTPDDVLKRRWLHELSAEDRAFILAVFDDRDKVVDMWREEGLCCMQVARGAF